MRVQVQSNKMISTVSFTAVGCSYIVYSGKKKILTVKQNESVKIRSVEDFINLSSSRKKYGRFTKLKFAGKNNNASFLLKVTDTASEGISYYDHLQITAKEQSLRFINVIDLEKYVEGTVAAEGGNNAAAEFYKVQSIICRTYALGHLKRHADEGFNLCDQVHCQAYNGIWMNNRTLNDAVIATKNKIIVDSILEIIIAAYHSNCGGQTAAAEDVWSKPLPYLQSVQDPFCCNGLHAVWEQKISLTDWLDYLKKKNLLSAFTDVAIICDTTFCCFPVKRKALFSLANSALAMRTIRDDWKFKSAYFTINQVGDTLIFNGRGYGHGVGLCQEGVMQMAKLGYSFEDIINFYYRNVSIVDADLFSFLNLGFK